MALTQHQLDEYIVQHGPYLYHETEARLDTIRSILSRGLTPAKHNFGFGGSRTNHVYIGTPHHIDEWCEGGSTPLIRVDLRMIDPTSLACDEDFVNGLYWNEALDTSGFFHQLQKAFPDLFEGSNFTLPRCKVEVHEWAEMEPVKKLLDSERATAFSLNQGSVSHRGTIDPKALSLNPAWAKRVLAREIYSHPVDQVMRMCEKAVI